jgi:hypothetical protein
MDFNNIRSITPREGWLNEFTERNKVNERED